MLRRLGRVLLWGFAFLGVGVFLALLAGGVFLWSLRPEPLPERLVLTVDLPQPPPHTRPPLPLPDRVPTAEEVARALHLAAEDPRVVAVAADVSGHAGPLAAVQELLPALDALRRAGIPTQAFAHSLRGPGTGYVLASAFQDLWLQPSGQLSLRGFGLEIPYAGALLSRLGIEGDFQRREAYKSGPESLTRQEMSAPVRDNLSTLERSMGPENGFPLTAVNSNYTPWDGADQRSC